MRAQSRNVSFARLACDRLLLCGGLTGEHISTALRREQDLDSVNQVLDAGLVNIPQPLDAEK